MSSTSSRCRGMRLIASCDVVARGAVRRELAEDLTARAVAACVPLVNRDDAPEHVRALSSPDVLAVEYDLVAQIINGAQRREDHRRRRRRRPRQDPSARGHPRAGRGTRRPERSTPRRAPSPSCSTSTACDGRDAEVGVANREMWTVVGSSAAYGAQDSTVPVSHVLGGEHTGAASAYVGMTAAASATSPTSSPSPSRTPARSG